MRCFHPTQPNDDAEKWPDVYKSGETANVWQLSSRVIRKRSIPSSKSLEGPPLKPRYFRVDEEIWWGLCSNQKKRQIGDSQIDKFVCCDGHCLERPWPPQLDRQPPFIPPEEPQGNVAKIRRQSETTGDTILRDRASLSPLSDCPFGFPLSEPATGAHSKWIFLSFHPFSRLPHICGVSHWTKKGWCGVGIVGITVESHWESEGSNNLKTYQ